MGGNPLRSRIAAAGACGIVAAASTATGAHARPMDAAAYRSQVNALCRSYTPRMKRVETTMTAARAAGDVHRFGYDLGVLMGLALREGLQVEKTPVPADAAARMVRPLRQLQTIDAQLARVVQRALDGDEAGVAVETLRLGKLQVPLNASFDAVGLRDCGSNQP
ncbi:MAG TPA: hypothetical protein VGN27_01790 [Gaiellaceae bacterium]|jgi:hypothetical protein|nr:hypothetical protein [Gaiellaceae bacterium]